MYRYDENATIGRKWLAAIIFGVGSYLVFSDAIVSLILAGFAGLIVPKKMVRVISPPKKEVPKQEQQKQEAPKQEPRKKPEPEPTSKKETFSKEQLQKMYHNLAKKYHPDFAQGEEDKKFRTELFRKIKDAYDRDDMDTMRMYDFS